MKSTWTSEIRNSQPLITCCQPGEGALIKIHYGRIKGAYISRPVRLVIFWKMRPIHGAKGSPENWYTIHRVTAPNPF